MVLKKAPPPTHTRYQVHRAFNIAGLFVAVVAFILVFVAHKDGDPTGLISLGSANVSVQDLYHCTPLYATVHHCTPLPTTVHHCTPLYTTAYHCTPLYSTVHHCLPLHTTVLHCTPLPTTVHHCTPLYTTVLHCTPLPTTVHHCTPLYTTVLHCTPLYTTVHHCTPLYTTAYHCMCNVLVCSIYVLQKAGTAHFVLGITIMALQIANVSLYTLHLSHHCML